MTGQADRATVLVHHHGDGPDHPVEHVVRQRSGRDVAVVMSNGAFGGIWDRLLARLRAVAAESGGK